MAEDEDARTVVRRTIVAMVEVVAMIITTEEMIDIEMMDEALLGGVLVTNKTKISHTTTAFSTVLDVAEEEDVSEEEAEEISTARTNVNAPPKIITRTTITKVEEEEEDTMTNPTIMIQITKRKDTEAEEDVSVGVPFEVGVEGSIVAEEPIKKTIRTLEEETSGNRRRLKTKKAVLSMLTLRKLQLSILLRSFRIGEEDSVVVAGGEDFTVAAVLPGEDGMVVVRMSRACWLARHGFAKKMSIQVMVEVLEIRTMLLHLHRRKAELNLSSQRDSYEGRIAQLKGTHESRKSCTIVICEKIYDKKKK